MGLEVKMRVSSRSIRRVFLPLSESFRLRVIFWMCESWGLAFSMAS